MSTIMVTNETRTPKWWVIDAKGQVVGRLAVLLANVLRGKHRPDFTPHIDTGDFVVVVNADAVEFTGKKWEQKTYDWYTGYPGGRRVFTAEDMHQRDPLFVLHTATRRMMPRTKLARQQIKKLKLYAGPQHPHQAQQPQELKLD